MKIPAQIKQRVETKLRECIDIVEKHYKVKLDMPKVTYTKGGGVAGTASYTTWTIDLNPVLLMENTDDFMKRTVPHELAHLACDKIYPEAHNRGFNDEAAGMLRMLSIRGHGRYRRPKRDIHGSRWQSIMRVLGADPSRCHSYDVTNVKRRKARFDYKCSKCGTAMSVGPKIHKQIQRDASSRWHRSCRGHPLVLVGAQPKVTPVTLPTRTPVQPGVGTKQQRAFAIYQSLKNQYDRTAIITRFMRDLGMTKAGASTYYYNCQKVV